MRWYQSITSELVSWLQFFGVFVGLSAIFSAVFAIVLFWLAGGTHVTDVGGAGVATFAGVVGLSAGMVIALLVMWLYVHKRES